MRLVAAVVDPAVGSHHRSVRRPAPSPNRRWWRSRWSRRAVSGRRRSYDPGRSGSRTRPARGGTTPGIHPGQDVTAWTIAETPPGSLRWWPSRARPAPRTACPRPPVHARTGLVLPTGANGLAPTAPAPTALHAALLAQRTGACTSATPTASTDTSSTTARSCRRMCPSRPGPTRGRRGPPRWSCPLFGFRFQLFVSHGASLLVSYSTERLFRQPNRPREHSEATSRPAPQAYRACRERRCSRSRVPRLPEGPPLVLRSGQRLA